MLRSTFVARSLRGSLLASTALVGIIVETTPAAAQYTASNQTEFQTAISNVNNNPGTSITITGNFNYTAPGGTAVTTAIPIALDNVGQGYTIGITGLGGPAGSLSVTGIGAGSILNLTGTNTFNGLSAATSVVAFDGAAALGSGPVTLTSQTLRALGNVSVTQAVGLAGQGATFDTNGQTMAISGVISGTSAGAGLFAGGGGTLTLSGANTYVGATTIIGTTLRTNAANVISTASAVVLTSGTFDLAGNNQSVGSLAGDAGSTVSLGAATLTAGSDNTNTNYFGSITGSGGLTKVGTGNLFLYGTNTYAGTTRVEGGNLTVGGGGTVASTDFVVVGGDLRLFGGAAPTSATVTQTGGQFSLGNSVTIGALSGSGGAGVRLAGGATLTVGGNNTNDTYGGNIGIDGNGALTKTGTGTFTLTGASAYAGATNIGSGTLQLGNGASAGSIANTSGISISAGASLAVDNPNALTISAPISGSGIVSQIGAGSTNLTGTLANVTLVVNAGSLGLASNLNSAGTAFGAGRNASAVYVTGGTFANSAIITATSAGVEDGVRIDDGALTNTGQITGRNGGASGVYVSNSAIINNTGAIAGQYGIYFGNGPAAGGLTVTGSGTITGIAGAGIAAANVPSSVTLGVAGAPLGAVTGNGGDAITVAVSGTSLISVVTGGNVTSLANTGLNLATSGSGAITVSTAGGTVQSGQDNNAISAINSSTGTGGAISITNADALQHGAGQTGGTGINVLSGAAGGITITNSGTIGASGGAFGNGIFANARTGAGSIAITSSAAVTGTTYGIFGYNENGGTGTITIDGSGAVGGGTYGIYATAFGTTTGAGNSGNAVVVQGTGGTVATGGTGIEARVAQASNAGSVLVTRSGSVTASGTGISAGTAGAGSVTVGTAAAPVATAGSTITAGGVGIDATSAGGAVSVVTGTGLVQSGANSNAINAINAGAGTAGAVSLNNSAALQHATGATGGSGLNAISRGTGGVSVANQGTIGATGGAFGNGIAAYTIGAVAGSVTVTSSAAVNGSDNGIVAFTDTGGTGTVSVNGSGAATGGNAGINALQRGPATGAGNGGTAVTVSGTGATTSTAGFGINAQVTQAANAGSVLVTRSGQVLAATNGINATTAGSGTVTVSAGPVSAGGTGIVTTATTGAVSVTADGAITAGNAGIFLTGSSAANTVTVNASGSVTGAIGLRLAGGGTTALSNNGGIATNAAGGNAVQIDGGTLVVGEGAGALTGNLAVVNAGASVLTVARTSDLALANTITGAGTLNQNGSGLLNLTGTNSAAAGQFTGTANVDAGILAVNGTLGDTAGNTATVNVNNGGTLHGSGTIAGSVNVASGATVSAGNSPGTLTVAGNYTLASGATSLFELGTPNVVGGSSNDLINVGGNLTLAGTLSLVSATSATTAPVSGTYRLYNYGGTLSGQFDAITTPTAGSTATIYTNIPTQVNVQLTNGGQTVQYWDGTDTTGASVGGQGGTATWNATNTNWTASSTSTVNNAWQSGVGIFGGTAGSITVAGTQSFQGLQFTVDGYRLAGDALNLTGDPFTTPGQSFVNVDAGVGTTIANALTSTGGTIGLRKLGDGTLTLTGVSTYTGATTVSAGTLVLAAGGSLASSVTNAATFVNAGTVGGALNNSGTAANTGTITGLATNTGSLTTSGTLAGGLTNTGTVIASAGQLNGTLANNSGTLTITGTVSSNGTLANAAGAGIAIEGAGAYSLAGLLSNAGTLSVASGGRLTAGSVNNAGSFTVAAGGTVVNALTNTGTLTNAGSYTADATNAAGATLTNTGTFSTVSQPFQNAGTLVTSGVLNGGLANTGTAQASGQLNGAVTNVGTLTFTGTTAGITTLANNGLADLGGTALSVGSLSGTSTGAVLRNGRLTTGSDNTSTSYAGAITDGASATSLTKVGTGIFTLTGTNTYTGGTTINAGTLVASAGSLGSGPVTANAALVLAQASDATLADALNGTGTLTKQGAGTLTYTGSGTLSGATQVQAGSLVVNGSLATSPITVVGGALVGGTGTIGGLSLGAGAAIAPGASPASGNVGTLNVAGNVLFAAGSLYQVDATAAGQADRITASGTATLQGGTVQITAGIGQYAPRTRYTLLSAVGGVTGQFSGVTSNFAFLTPFLTYDANDAYLTLARNDLQFATVAVTRNQNAVAGAVQATGVGSRLYDSVAVLSAGQARQAFNALSGEIHDSAVTAQFATAYLVREAILDRLRFGEAAGLAAGVGAQGVGQRFAPGTTLPATYTADLPGRAPAFSSVPAQLTDPNPIAVWGQGFGAFGSVGGNGNAARLDQQTSGFVLGADTRIDAAWRLGAAGGYTYTSLDVTGRQSSGSVESGFGALYAGASYGALQLRLGGSYAGSNLDVRRAVTFSGFGESERARYGGDLGQAFGEVGYRFGAATAYVEPFVGGAAIRISRDRINEIGGAAALTAAGRDYDLATSTVGVQAQGRLDTIFGTDMPILIRGLVGYRRAYGDVIPSTLFTFGAAGQPFVTAGVPIARNALVAEGGLDWQVSPSTTLSVAYTGQVGSEHTQDHGVKGSFLYRW